MDLVKRCLCFYCFIVAVLQAHVIIKNKYPSEAPIFLLSLNYNGTHNSLNSDDIRVSISVNMLFS